MSSIPTRRLDSISDRTNTIIANAMQSLRQSEQRKAKASVPTASASEILLKDALASGKFTYYKHGIYKEADTDKDYGKIWVKKTIKDPITGNQQDWLCVYTDDEDDIVRQTAQEYRDVLVKTAAAVKTPNPKDVPIAPGIKSKNLTIDETGGQGTAKVTVEFSDVDKGLEFFQEQGGSGGGAAKTEEEPAVQGPTEQPAIPPKAQPQGPGVPQQNIQPAPASLQPTVHIISVGGQQGVEVLKEVLAIFRPLRHNNPVDTVGIGNPGGIDTTLPHEKPKNWDRMLKTKEWPESEEPLDVSLEPGLGESDIPSEVEGTDICPSCKATIQAGELVCTNCGSDVSAGEDLGLGGVSDSDLLASLQYSFVNEAGQKVLLNWTKDLKIGSQFERPDTGDTVRLIGYKESRLVTEDVLVNDLVTANCPPGEKSKREVKELKAEGVPESEAYAIAWKQHNKKEKKESSLQFTAADVSDQIPPMSWTNDESQNDKPAGAGPALPQQPNLGQENQTKPNILYDSNQDTGPQFQTTIDPKDKSVKVKFIDSPQADALTQAINEPQQPIGQPPAQQPPAVPPVQPAGQGAPQQQGFQDQQVPVNF